MTNFPKWQDVRDGIVAGAGGEEAVTGARHRNQAYIDGHRLAERRKSLGLTQAQVAERMSVTKSRVSQIERGEVSTIEAVARYQLDPAPAQHLGQGRARRALTGLELVGLLAHALPVGRIGSRPGGDAPPAGEELIQRRQVDDGRVGDGFELGIERGDVGGGQRRAHGREGPLDVRMGSVESLDGHDDA
jgi:DNA-binding XRE family transcriptional regulator